jgi:hypothetical protein
MFKFNKDKSQLLNLMKDYIASFNHKHDYSRPSVDYDPTLLDDLVEAVLSDDSLDSIELDENKIVDKVLMEIEDEACDEHAGYEAMPVNYGPDFEWPGLEPAIEL